MKAACCLLAIFLCGVGAQKVTLTPWCDNSMRVRITPDDLPPAAQAAKAALAKTLAAKNMTDLEQ